MRILHVIESFGGGVITAVHDYMVSTPGFEHHLLLATREGHETGADFQATVRSLQLLPTGHLPRVYAVDKRYRALRPDVVHAHSSYAGVYVRFAPSIPAARIAYTPHCFAFERLDLPPLGRSAVRAIEAVLARRTGAYLSVNPHEADLARSLKSNAPTFYIPNIGRVGEERATHTPHSGSSTRIAAAGRLAPQKDPRFFQDVVRHALLKFPELEFTWVGGGDSTTEDAIRSAGARVTGWIPRSSVLQELSSSDIYLHTAAWEGSPVTLLEAAALGLPIVARDIAPLRALDVGCLGNTPSDVAHILGSIARDPELMSAAKKSTESIQHRHSPSAQTQALDRAYEHFHRR